MRGRLLRIVSPYFVAGVIVGEDAAPIIAYMARWPEAQIVAYCRRKRWTVEPQP